MKVVDAGGGAPQRGTVPTTMDVLALRTQARCLLVASVHVMSASSCSPIHTYMHVTRGELLLRENVLRPFEQARRRLRACRCQCPCSLCRSITYSWARVC